MEKKLKDIKHTELRSIAMLCGGFALLVGVAVFIGNSEPVRVVLQEIEPTSQTGNMYYARTDQGLTSYGNSGSRNAENSSGNQNGGDAGYPAPLGCAYDENSSDERVICVHNNNYHNIFGVMSVYKENQESVGDSIYFRGEEAGAGFDGWRQMWAAPLVYRVTGSGDELLPSSGAAPSQPTVFNIIFKRTSPGEDAHTHVNSAGYFGGDYYTESNTDNITTSERRASLRNLPTEIFNNDDSITVPAGVPVRIEWACQPYQINYFEYWCGSADELSGDPECTTARILNMFDWVDTRNIHSDNDGPETSSASTPIVKNPYNDTLYRVQCEADGHTITRSGVGVGYPTSQTFKAVIPDRSGPWMNFTVYTINAGDATTTSLSPKQYKYVGETATIDWRAVDVYSCRLYKTGGPSSGDLDSTTRLDPYCNTLRSSTTASFTQPGTYQYTLTYRRYTTAGVAVDYTQSTEVGVTCPAGTTWDGSICSGPATITISSSGSATEGGSSASVTFTRTGSTASALVVNFTTSNTAVRNTDYSLSGGSIAVPNGTTVTIPAGSASVIATVAPRANDSSYQGNKIATISVASGSGYSGSGSVNINVNDDDVADICTDIPGNQPPPTAPSGCNTPATPPGTCIPPDHYWSGSACVPNPAVITSLMANPARVRAGNNTLLTWTGTGLPESTGCTLSSNPVINGGSGATPRTVPTTATGNSTGEYAGPIEQTTIFTLTCGTGSPAQKTVTVIPNFEEI